MLGYLNYIRHLFVRKIAVYNGEIDNLIKVKNHDMSKIDLIRGLKQIDKLIDKITNKEIKHRLSAEELSTILNQVETLLLSNLTHSSKTKIVLRLEEEMHSEFQKAISSQKPFKKAYFDLCHYTYN